MAWRNRVTVQHMNTQHHWNDRQKDRKKKRMLCSTQRCTPLLMILTSQKYFFATVLWIQWGLNWSIMWINSLSAVFLRAELFFSLLSGPAEMSASAYISPPSVILLRYQPPRTLYRQSSPAPGSLDTLLESGLRKRGACCSKGVCVFENLCVCFQCVSMPPTGRAWKETKEVAEPWDTHYIHTLPQSNSHLRPPALSEGCHKIEID